MIDFNTLEVIRHFYFPLWEREVLYIFRIFKLSKEDEAKAHLQYLQSIYNSGYTFIYTDGSQTPKGCGVGYSVAVYTHTQGYPLMPTFTKIGNLGEAELVYNGELEAIT